MKVIAPGVLFAAGGVAHISGWHFDAERASYHDQVNLNRDSLKAVLLHVAQCHGITFVAPKSEPEPVASLDVERMALDAIAVARWSQQS